jgi:hypothetical protein
MGGTTFLIVAGVWVGAGLLTGLWLARRGHAPLWTLVAVILGPLFIPIALERAERHPRLAASASGTPPPAAADDAQQDGLRVLVGLDGSPESRQALDTALAVLGGRCRTLVLIEVVSYDAGGQDQALDAATSRLQAAASGLEPQSVSYGVLTGPPADALRRFARTRTSICSLSVGAARGCPRGCSAASASISSRVVKRRSCFPDSSAKARRPR